MRRSQESLTGPRSRPARIGAGIAALVVFLMGVAAAPAQALKTGEFIVETELGGGKLQTSQGVTVDGATGDIYAADVQLDRILKFNAKGELLLQFGTQGTEQGNFMDPYAVATDSAGSVYVADSGNHRIQKFDGTGGFLTAWGELGSGNGQFKTPQAIAVGGAGAVYVLDSAICRIQKFSADGAYLGEWGSKGSGSGEFASPSGIAVTPGGNVVVADSGNNRIQIFDGNGTPLEAWGTKGTGAGQLDFPTGIAVDDEDKIYVADFFNDRIQKFSGTGASLAIWPAPTGLWDIDFNNDTRRLYASTQYDSVTVFREATKTTFTAGPKTRGVAGKTYSSTLKTAGFPKVSAFAVASGKLPSGLKLAGDKISGIAKKPGTYKIKLRAENGVDPAAVLSSTITIQKARSVIKTSWSTKHPKAKQPHIKAKIRVSAPDTAGLSRTGSIALSYGSKRVKTFKVHPSDHGVIAVKLPVFSTAGKKKVAIRYLGNSQLTSDTYVTYVHVH